MTRWFLFFVGAAYVNAGGNVFQVVGIIDYMRQYDIIKRMERMGKSVSMIAGQAEPTIVQPSLYKARFQQVPGVSVGVTQNEASRCRKICP